MSFCTNGGEKLSGSKFCTAHGTSCENDAPNATPSEAPQDIAVPATPKASEKRRYHS